jgi:hypothetical protein
LVHIPKVEIVKVEEYIYKKYKKKDEKWKNSYVKFHLIYLRSF